MPLKENEKFRALFDASIDAIFIETIDGRILDCNETGCSMYGYSLEELQKLKVSDLVPAEVTDRLHQLESIIQQRGGFFIQAEGLRKNGEVFPTEVSARLMDMDDQRVIVVFVRDITDRISAERNIRENRRMLYTLLSNLPGMAYRRKLDRNWTVEFTSEGSVPLTGFSPADLVANRTISYAKLVADEDRKTVVKTIQKCIKAGNSFQVEYRIIDRDNKVKWVWEQGRGIYNDQGILEAIEGFTSDITQRRLAEENLAKSANKLKIINQIDQDLMSEISLVGIAQKVVDYLARLVKCNFICIMANNYNNDEAIVLSIKQRSRSGIKVGACWPMSLEMGYGQQDYHAKISNLKKESTLSLFQRKLLQAGMLHHCQIPILYKKTNLLGSIHLADKTPFKSEDLALIGEIAAPMAIAFYQAYLYEKIQHYAEDLEHRVIDRTSKLQATNAELESFSYSVSHDLRAPLKSIHFFTQSFLEENSNVLKEAGIEKLQRIKTEAQKMDELIRDLLAYSQVGRSEISLEPVNLDKVVSEAILQHEIDITAKKVKLEISRPLNHVMGNYILLLQIVSNLLSNAIKFVVERKIPIVKVWTEKRDRYIRFWMEDNGIGIASDDQDRIFRLFERINRKEEFPGTGIGLAIVRKSIERLDGRYGLISSLGNGSKFWFELFSADNTHIYFRNNRRE